MAGVEIHILVHSMGALNEIFDAEVEVVETGENPCQQCIDNAESPDPEDPPLHPHCHCEKVMVSVSAMI